MISGDNPLTVSVIAAEAGIEGAERYVDASMFENRRVIMRAGSPEKYTVFGRVTPNQKRMLVQAIKGTQEDSRYDWRWCQ